MSLIRIPAFMCISAVLLAVGAGCAQHKGMYDEPLKNVLSGVLDGKTYVGDLGLMGAAPSMRETITFKDGYFHSSACDQYHFKDGAYLAVESAGATNFMVITHNREHSTIVWKGTVKGDTLEGTMTLYEKDKPPLERWVRAQKQ